jgi:alkylation response protein AidB-like acyl-CoA dehydrogenase
MNFSLAEEQQLLADALARFVERDYGFDARRAIVKSEEGWSRKAWHQLAELGVLGLMVPEEHGGFGGTSVDAMIVMNALGRGLVVEPFLQTAIIGATLVAAAGDEAQKAALLPAIAGGEKIVALAHGEGQPGTLATRAVRQGEEWQLTGAKRVVLHGGAADTLIVTALTDTGLGLFLATPGTAGVTVRRYRTIDGLRAADVELAGAIVAGDRVLGEPGKVDAALALALDRGVAGLCAEAVGVMEDLNRQTLEYIKTRQQFGQPIGRFQALQHRAADMFIDGEQSKSMAYLAAMKCASPDAAERGRAVSGAKAYIGRTARRVAHEAIQLHGGMGVTEELPASHYAKRLRMVDFWFGDADGHIARFLSLS